MLYDPKWNTKTAVEPLSVEGLIAWLERQPAGTKYDYGCNGHCLLATYLRAAHGWDPDIGGTVYRDHKSGAFGKLPAALNDIAWSGPRTYGGALKRARAKMP